MTVILRTMRLAANDPGRDEVIIPAYTCYSVPASIERAGLRPRLCDIDAVTLGMDPERLRHCDFSRVLAVVSANLYGLPNDLAAIESICRERGVYCLDDAAQALGASISGRPVGAFGDVGLFSFDKGKVISTIQGGAIVCGSNALVEQLESAVAALPATGLRERTTNLLKLGIYSIFLRPALYPLVRALPFTGLGHTTYEPRYPITCLSEFSSAVAERLLAKLDELGSARRRNAAGLESALDGLPAIELIRPLPGAIPAYARFPVRLRDTAARTGLIAALDRAGIGASASYPSTLADVPEVRAKLPPADTDCPGARRIASTILTLPTHAFCPPELPERVRKVIVECTI
jgi:dTDP-4-amino-4,6-dideoxygalactose transaminase